jgi:hypothetical protein
MAVVSGARGIEVDRGDDRATGSSSARMVVRAATLSSTPNGQMSRSHSPSGSDQLASCVSMLK